MRICTDVRKTWIRISAASAPTRVQARSVNPCTSTSSTKNLATAATARLGIVAIRPMTTTASTSDSTGRSRRPIPRIRAGGEPPAVNSGPGRRDRQIRE